MFKAVILVCSILASPNCIVLEDMYGPYKTIEQCKERLVVMEREMTSMILFPITYQLQCVSETKTTDEIRT